MSDDGKALPIQVVSGRQISQPRTQVTVYAKCAGRGQLGASSAILYTAPSVTTPTGSTQGALLDQLILCNTDASDRTVTIYVIETGGSVAADRAIISGATIIAGQTIVLEFGPLGCPLDSGETVRGLASSAAKVTYRLSVRELT